MANLRNLCVYCGSKNGHDPVYAALARELGRRCAESGVGVVFGGGHIGLMGQLAQSTLEGGGKVVGILPEHLRQLEVADEAISELVIVDSMHTRKRMLAERADAFCVLPGGLGSLDEMVEIITWKQLGLHDKPVVLLDHEGYWQPFLNLIEHQTRHGFVSPGARDLFSVAADLDAMFEAVAAHPEPELRTAGGRL